ncbi:MAG TPA: YceD family protein [Burkholderiaceae bacterium]|nr:YceD family protein [Burkholderiaceae bacterium]
MKARDFDPAKLDVEAFAKAGARLEGVWPLEQLERLRSSTVAGSGSHLHDVAWSALGELRPVRGGAAEIWLHVEASAQVMLECQRCLAPVATAVGAKRSFLFVHGENTAADLDAESEDDVLALTRALDLVELIEDELLLELPLVPRHETCPSPLPAGDATAQAAEDDAPHPFAALAALKRGGLPN